MNSLKYAIISILLLATVQGQAQSVGTTTDQMPDSVKSTQKYSKFGLELGLAGGVDDNPAQLPELIKRDSSFFQIKPKISYERELAKEFFLMTNLGADFKDYDDNIISDVKSAFKAQFDLGFTYFINERHEIGVTTSEVFNRSSGLNFTSSGLSTSGRDIEYIQFFNEVYYSYNREKFNIELSGNIVSNRNDAFVQDEVVNTSGGFDEFKDDFDQVGVKLKLNYRVSDDADVYIEPSYSKRSYKERAARFSEGNTDQANNPLLEEEHNGVGIGYKFNDDFVNAEVKGLFVKERDLIFRANNATNLGIEAKVSVPVGVLFKLGGEYSWTKREYDFFVTDPSVATSEDLRNDESTSWALLVSKSFGKTSLELKYNALNKDSNYRPFNSNIGSQYDEEIISLGLNIKL